MKTTCDKNGNVTIIFYEKEDAYNLSNLSDTDKTRLLYLLGSLSVSPNKKEELISIIINSCSFELKKICNELYQSNDILKDVNTLKLMLL